MTEIFAVTTRGLEDVCAGEMAQLAGLRLREVGYRRVTASYNGPVAQLLQLRTVDDLFLDLGEWHGIGTDRATLDEFQQLSGQLDLWHSLSLREQIQPLPPVPSFSVSANFVGKRNYSSEEIKLAVGGGIGEVYGWEYRDNDAVSDLNIRLFIEHETAYVGMRLGNAPLHRRAYKQQSVKGSLKATIAAAMLQLADVTPGSLVLDPCCGAGTIMIEAAQMGAAVLGGDSDDTSVDMTRSNAALAQVALDVRQWDAQALPLDAQMVDRVVTNLPWGRQVTVSEKTGLAQSDDQALNAFYGRVCGEIERVLADDGRVVLLTNVPQAVRFATLGCVQRSEISVFGQTPTLLVYARDIAQETTVQASAEEETNAIEDSAPDTSTPDTSTLDTSTPEPE